MGATQGFVAGWQTWPTVALPLGMPLTDQVTEVSVVLVTLGVNEARWPSARVAVAGETVTRTLLLSVIVAEAVTAPLLGAGLIQFGSWRLIFWVMAGFAALLVVGGLVLAATEGKPEGTSPVRGATPARLGSIDSNRYRYWQEAGKTFTRHPLIGIGSDNGAPVGMQLPRTWGCFPEFFGRYVR